MEAKENTMSKLEKDVLEIVANWKEKYSKEYENTLPTTGYLARQDWHIYELEKEKIGPGHIATSWISRILRTHFGYREEYVSQNITSTFEGLVQKGKLEQIITGPLDPNYTPFDGPLYKTISTARRGVALTHGE